MDILSNGVVIVSQYEICFETILFTEFKTADVYMLLKLTTCRKNQMCLKRVLCKLYTTLILY